MPYAWNWFKVCDVVVRWVVCKSILVFSFAQAEQLDWLTLTLYWTNAMTHEWDYYVLLWYFPIIIPP